MSVCCPGSAAVRKTDGYEDVRRRLEGTNINGQTLLATDYLNHFNEIVMILEILPDCPECFEDAREWRPKTYRQHFADSMLSDSALAIEAYDHCPARFREPFERVVEHMDNLVMFALRRLAEPVARQDAATIRRIAEAVGNRLEMLITMASGIIHGNVQTVGQRDIDALLARPS